MTTVPYAWRCTACRKLVAHAAVEPRGEEWWHWDLLRQDWCGRAERVELQCEPS